MEEQTKFIIVMLAIMLVVGALHVVGVSFTSIAFIGVGAYFATYAIFMLF